MRGTTPERQKTRRRLALVLLAALLAVGSCSYLTGGQSGTSPHKQARSTGAKPSNGGVTVVAGGGGSQPGGAAGGDAEGGPGPASSPSSGATHGGSGSTNSTPGRHGGAVTPRGGSANHTPASSASSGSGGSSGSTGSGGSSGSSGSGGSSGSSGSGGTSSGSNFSISAGVSSELYPGAPAQPLDLALTNPNGYALSVTSLVVSLNSITLAADPAPPGQCTPSDFEIDQFSGSLPLTIPAGSTVTLSGLGLSPSEMPQIRMLDQPYNQDGCEGATLNLSYSGTATG